MAAQRTHEVPFVFLRRESAVFLCLFTENTRKCAWHEAAFKNSADRIWLSSQPLTEVFTASGPQRMAACLTRRPGVMRPCGPGCMLQLARAAYDTFLARRRLAPPGRHARRARYPVCSVIHVADMKFSRFCDEIFCIPSLSLPKNGQVNNRFSIFSKKRTIHISQTFLKHSINNWAL